MQRSVQPSPSANALYRRVRGLSDLHREMLRETERPVSGTLLESGRSVCAETGDVLEPIDRRVDQVDLPVCQGPTAVLHTHTPPDDMSAPTLTVQDLAVVLFGGVEVIGVVGTQSAEYFVAPENQSAAINVLASALEPYGRTLDSFFAPSSGFPSSAQSDIRDRLSACFYTDFLSFKHITAPSQQPQPGSVTPHETCSPCSSAPAQASAPRHPPNTAHNIQQQTSRCGTAIAGFVANSGLDIWGTVVGSALSAVVRDIVEDLLLS